MGYVCSYHLKEKTCNLSGGINDHRLTLWQLLMPCLCIRFFLLLGRFWCLPDRTCCVLCRQGKQLIFLTIARAERNPGNLNKKLAVLPTVTHSLYSAQRSTWAESYKTLWSLQLTTISPLPKHNVYILYGGETLSLIAHHFIYGSKKTFETFSSHHIGK